MIFFLDENKIKNIWKKVFWKRITYLIGIMEFLYIANYFGDHFGFKQENSLCFRRFNPTESECLNLKLIYKK